MRDPVQSVWLVALTGVAMARGLSVEDAEQMLRKLRNIPIPETLTEVYEQIDRAISEIRDERQERR